MAIERTLNHTEIRYIAALGALRCADVLHVPNPNRFGRPDRRGRDGREDVWAAVIESYASEYIVARELNQFWNGLRGHDSELRDCGKHIQVKMHEEHGGHLIVPDFARDTDVFVYVTGRMPAFLIYGWMSGREIKAKGKEQHTDKGLKFWMPHDQLWPLRDIPRLLL